jgi:hypothetical protein
MAPNWRKEYSRYQIIFAKVLEVYRKRPDVKTFLELLLTLSTVAIFTVFALKPTVITIIQLLKDIKTKETVIVQMDTKIKALASAQNLFSQEARRIVYVTKSVPEKALPENLVRELEGLAQKNAVTLNSVSINELTLLGVSTEKVNPKEQIFLQGASGLAFTANTNADFTVLLPFLKDLEKFLRPVVLDSFSIATGVNQETKTINMSISGKVPYLSK